MPLAPRTPGATWPVEATAGDVPPLPIVEKLNELRVSNVGDSMPGLTQTNRLYDAPTGGKTETLQVNINSSINEQIGFTARSMRVSNFTTQFGWIETVGDYISPYQVNVVWQIPSGTQNAKILLGPNGVPPGITQPAASTGTSEQLIVTMTEDFLMPSAGILLKLPTVP